MSNTEDNGAEPERDAFQELESAVTEMLSEIETLRERAAEAEARADELGELVKRFTGDEGEAERLLSRLKSLETENEDLKVRLDKGRDGVDRILARIKFLEEQR